VVNFSEAASDRVWSKGCSQSLSVRAVKQGCAIDNVSEPLELISQSSQPATFTHCESRHVRLSSSITFDLTTLRAIISLHVFHERG
jgi:hypothetical protein